MIDTIFFIGAGRSWSSMQQLENAMRDRQHYIAKEFAKNRKFEVYFINYISRREYFSLKDEGKVNADPATKFISKDIYITQMLPERPWIPFTHQLNSLIMRKMISTQIPHPKKDSLTWCYFYKSLPLLKRLALSGKLIIDVDHNFIKDTCYTSYQAEEARVAARDIAQISDFIVGSSRSVLDELSVMGARSTYHLRNGICLERFQQSPEAPHLPLESIPRPIIGYVGLLTPWIDWELLEELAIRNPKWSFFIGGNTFRDPPLESLRSLNNVFLPGNVSPSDAPLLMKSFDVVLGLYPSSTGDWCDGDSMKIYEYLAAKTPMVTTPYHPKLEGDFPGLLSIVNTIEDYEEKIAEILRWKPSQRSHWESSVDSFLNTCSWKQRLDEALRASLISE